MTKQRRRIAPAVAMTLSVVLAITLAILAPWLGSVVSPLAPERPALVPPQPVGQAQLPVPDWIPDNDCTSFTTHFTGEAAHVWVGEASGDILCVVVGNPDGSELGGGTFDVDARIFNSVGTWGTVSTGSWYVGYILLPSNADLSNTDVPGFEAVTEHLLLSEAGLNTREDTIIIPTTDGAPSIKIPPQVP